MRTVYDIDINNELFLKKLNAFVNQFYKILPIKESGESSLQQYMKSLQREMLGCKTLIVALDNDAQYLSLLSILQYMIENDCDVATVRSDVFKAIGILKKLQTKLSKALKEGSA